MKLTTTQRTVLSTALQRDDGTIKLPANLKGGTAQKVVGKLLAERLVEEIPARGSMPVWRKEDERSTALCITAAGLAAIQSGGAAAGKQTKKTRSARRGSSTNKKKVPGTPKQTAKSAKPRHKPKSGGHSKQDRVIALLSRRQGTNIAALMKATGWQRHSVRGFFAGVVRKKLGLKLVSEKIRGVRTYRIADRKRAGKAG